MKTSRRAGWVFRREKDADGFEEWWSFEPRRIENAVSRALCDADEPNEPGVFVLPPVYEGDNFLVVDASDGKEFASRRTLLGALRAAERRYRDQLLSAAATIEERVSPAVAAAEKLRLIAKEIP